MWIFTLLIIIIFFFLSAFFSGMETGLISIDRMKMEQQAKKSKKKKQILHILENPDKLFGTTLFGTNISVVIVTSLSILLINIFNQQKNAFHISETTATLIIAGFILVFAEIIPKALYRENPNKLVTRGFPLLRFFSLILLPFVKFVSLLNSLLARLFKLSEKNGFHILTRVDLSYMLAETKDDGVLHEDQRDMLEEALEFTELDAGNVMIHRTEIVALEKDTPIDEVISIAKEKGFTRFPVYDGDLDHIIGILIIYDLIKKDNVGKMKASDFVREAFFASEIMDVDNLLAEMQANKNSMAIIVDSFGGTAGLVTIEDILEEIVGEIEDEYDTTTPMEVEKIEKNHYKVPGFVEIDFLNDEYEMNLPEGDYETIAGLIINKLEKIPRQNTKLTINQWNITILQVSDVKILKLEMKYIGEKKHDN